MAGMNGGLPAVSTGMPHETARPSRIRRLARECSLLFTVVVVMLSARSSLADHYHIPTGSMEPTVHAGDRVVVIKTAYDLRLPFSDRVIAELDDPSRGDVVVLDSPEQDLLLLKRIVAVPGDRVSVESGQVWIDGKRVAMEPFIKGAMVEKLGEDHMVLLDSGGGPDMPSTLVPKDHYLVLGDNRGDSRDGRSFGLISRSAIRGRAARVYFSLGSLDWRSL